MTTPTTPGIAPMKVDRAATSLRRAVSTLVGALLLAAAGLAHSQTPVRDLDNPAKQPFQAELRRLAIPAGGSGQTFRMADVPPGKRLVIEHVSFRLVSLEASTPGSPPARFSAFASLMTNANGVPGSHEVIANRIDLGNGASFVAASQPIRAYADAGSPVLVQIAGRSSSVSDSLQVTHLTVSGHLVDVP